MNRQGDDVTIQSFYMLFTSKVTRSVVNNCAKVTQLEDGLDSLTNALMGILVENTNDRSMLSLE